MFLTIPSLYINCSALNDFHFAAAVWFHPQVTFAFCNQASYINPCISLLESGLFNQKERLSSQESIRQNPALLIDNWLLNDKKPTPLLCKPMVEENVLKMINYSCTFGLINHFSQLLKIFSVVEGKYIFVNLIACYKKSSCNGTQPFYNQLASYFVQRVHLQAQVKLIYILKLKYNPVMMYAR